jgi:hypothetical protein
MFFEHRLPLDLNLTARQNAKRNWHPGIFLEKIFQIHQNYRKTPEKPQEIQPKSVNHLANHVYISLKAFKSIKTL